MDPDRDDRHWADECPIELIREALVQLPNAERVLLDPLITPLLDAGAGNVHYFTAKLEVQIALRQIARVLQGVSA